MISLFISCTPKNNWAVLNIAVGIEKGMTEDDLFKLVPEWEKYQNKDWKFEAYDIIINDKKYLVYAADIYVLHYDDYYGSSTVTMQYYCPYLFTFENGKLIYWGHIYEYTRSRDKDIEKLGVAILNSIELKED